MKKYLLLLFFLPALTNAQSIPYGSNPKTGSYFNHDGVKVYYEVYGTGQPLVLLHGNGGSIRSRANMLPELSSHYKVIAFDARCHGKTDCPSGYLTYEQMASDVNAVLNYLKLDSVYMWGHSDGGILGLLMAIHYPKKVKKILASGPNMRPDTTAIDPALTPIIDKMWKVMKKDSASVKQFKLLVDQPHITTAQLKTIKADILIMGGDRDAIRNEHLVEMFKAIPGAELCILPGTTHFVYQDRPKWFMEIMYDFFDKPQNKKTTAQLMGSQF
jgi:pimeloyl-ACP methyl ester carboxylesterase